MKDFSSFGLPEALQNRLAHMEYKEPTDIQMQAIPLILSGKDILGSAQTGTGKTGAFTIPIIAKLMQDTSATAIILTPTRELASQVYGIVEQMVGKNKKEMPLALLIGGDSITKQHLQLKRNPRIVIGTPGRINDHLRRRSVDLSHVAFVVLDETDRMLDMGFGVQIDEILRHVPEGRQTLLFSATLPKAIVKLADNYLTDPERIKAGEANKVADNLIQEVIETNNKYQTLLSELEKREGTVIIFMKTQRSTEQLAAKLNEDGFESDSIHGGLKQSRRDRVIKRFRAMDYRILVATDVAARGLDIPHISHVINYDLPQNPEDFIHRIGRTARAAASGHALTFLTSKDKEDWRSIQKFLNGKDDGEMRDPYSKPKRSSGGFRGSRSGSSSGFRGREGGRSEGRDFGGGERRSFDRPRRASDDAQPVEGAHKRSAFFDKRKNGDSVDFHNKEGGYRGRSEFKPRGAGFRGDRPATDRNSSRTPRPMGFLSKVIEKTKEFAGVSERRRPSSGFSGERGPRSSAGGERRTGSGFSGERGPRSSAGGERRTSSGFSGERGPRSSAGGERRTGSGFSGERGPRSSAGGERRTGSGFSGERGPRSSAGGERRPARSGEFAPRRPRPEDSEGSDGGTLERKRKE